LWDHGQQLFPGVSSDRPSCGFTHRVVESLVSAADVTEDRPLPDPLLITQASAMLREAEHLLEQELLIMPVATRLQPAAGRIEAQLRRARQIVLDRPAGAMTLIGEALGELEKRIAAREIATESTR
jgi:hypothetical protein